MGVRPTISEIVGAVVGATAAQAAQREQVAATLEANILILPAALVTSSH
jgi:hypothetical protein